MDIGRLSNFIKPQSAEPETVKQEVVKEVLSETAEKEGTPSEILSTQQQKQGAAAQALEARFTFSAQEAMLRSSLQSALENGTKVETPYSRVAEFLNPAKEDNATAKGSDTGMIAKDLRSGERLSSMIGKSDKIGSSGVGTLTSDPVESDPAFQKLPEETKEHIRTDLRNTPDEAGKANIRKLAADPSFDSISPESQKTALEDLAEDPSSDLHAKGVFRTCSDMAHLEGSGDFKNLPPDTQGALRTAMFHNSGKDSARDTLIGFVHNPNFARMSPANQQRTIAAFQSNTNVQPSGSDNGVHLNNIIGSPSFQKMSESMQQQVLSMATRTSADEKGMQSITKLLGDSNFEQLSPATQKRALEDLDENPSSDEHLQGVRRTCSDMVSLENSGDFKNLPVDTQDALRNAMFNFSGKDSTRDGLISFVHNPNFAKMSAANQQRMIGAYLTNPSMQPSGVDNSVYLNTIIGSKSFQGMSERMQQDVITLASRNSMDEKSMKSITKLMGDPSFEQISPESQKAALDDLAGNPSSEGRLQAVRRTCSDMVSIDGSDDFKNLPADTQAALRTAMFNNSEKDSARDTMISFIQNPDFAKMSSANQQRMIGAYLSNSDVQPSGSDNGAYLNNMIGSPSFQNMDESMQQKVLTLASRNSHSEEKMKGLSDLLRDPEFVNASREEQIIQLDRQFSVHDPNQEF